NALEERATSEIKLIETNSIINDEFEKMSVIHERHQTHLRSLHESISTEQATWETLIERCTTTNDSVATLTNKQEAIITQLDSAESTLIPSLEQSLKGFETTLKDVVNKGNTSVSQLFHTNVDLVNELGTKTETTLSTLRQSVSSALEGEAHHLAELHARSETFCKDFAGHADQMEMKGKALERYLEQWEKRLEVLLTRDSVATNSVRNQARRMDDALELANTSVGLVSSRCDEIVTHIEKVSQTLNENSTHIGTMLTEDTKMFSGLEDRASSLHTNITGVATSLEQLSGTVAGRLRELAELSKNHLEQLDTYDATIHAKAERLAESGQQASLVLHQWQGNVDGMNATMSAGMKSVADTVGQWEQSLKHYGGEADQWTNTIEKVTASAFEAATRLQREDDVFRRRGFLQRTRLILQNLNGVSVDLFRLVLSEWNEDMLKQYMRGDRTVFTRMLAKSKAKDFVALARKRVADDSEIRAMALDYIDQFRSVMSEAETVDPQGLLPTALMTADVGRLFVLLEQVTENLPQPAIIAE
ncbi:MAG: hypothetical protein K0U36_03850, partial [Alphaproteobacteria bacterium]|nr:hypothetical protein [Alphaproteobacteria bacterium]